MFWLGIAIGAVAVGIGLFALFAWYLSKCGPRF